MKLTEDERTIADRVAWRYAVGGAAFDAAWGLALHWIAARRRAIGDAEPGTATAAGEASAATVQSVISDMAGILTSATADADDLHAAAVTMVEALHQQYDLPPATAAGVGADDEKPVAWCVVMPTGQARYVTMRRDGAVDTARGEDEIVPLYRRGASRGVVVTPLQREAIASALREACSGSPLWTQWPLPRCEALSDLLAAIDAANGGGA